VEDALDSAKQKKKKDKVRSAWIGFMGRIVAQLVGAIATVALGVMVLNRYTGPTSQPPGYHNATALPTPAASEPALTTYTEPAVTIIFISPHTSPAAGGAGEPELPAAVAARQAEVARAIAKAMSGPLPRLD
jgi:hypothetical protein